MIRKYFIIGVLLGTSLAGVFAGIRPVHATTSPGPRTYLGNCYLSYTPTTNVLTGGSVTFTGASGGAGCNGVGYVATAVSTAVAGQFSITQSVTFQDQYFQVPNLGQSYTTMSLSMDYFVLGYLGAEGVVAGCCWATTSTSLTVQAYLYQEPIGGGTPVIYQGNDYWTLHSSADWGINNCGGIVAAPCAQSLPISGVQSWNLPAPVSLTPGYQYAIDLTFTSQSSATVGGIGSIGSGSCFDYTTFNNWGGGCQSPYAFVNGGNLPEQPSTSCPSGTSSNPCFYIQWKDSTVNLTDSTTGTPDFSIGLSGSLSVLDGNFGVSRDYKWITLTPLNGFSGSVNLYTILYPPHGATILPRVYFMSCNAVDYCLTKTVYSNGTSWSLASGPVGGYLNLGIEADSFCQPVSGGNGLGCVPGTFTSPGLYTIVVEGISGSIAHQVVLPLNIQYYDLSVQQVSYSSGTISATVVNVGNGFPQGIDWGEVLYFYGNGALIGTVYLCGYSFFTGLSFLHASCPSGVQFTVGQSWSSPTASGYNVTVTATEINPQQCSCNTNFVLNPGEYFDINLNSNTYGSNFGLVGPGSVSVTAGAAITTTMTLRADSAFQGTVSMSGSSPSGWGLSYNTTIVSLNPGQSQHVAASITVPSSASPGTYSMTFIGTSGTPAITHSVALSVIVNSGGDFSLCCSNSFSLPAGGAMLSTGVNIQSLSGFAGTVSLKLSTTMVGDTTISLSPTSITLSSGQSASSALGITSGSQTGTWSFTVTGQSGNLVHSLNYTVIIFACCTGGGGSVADGTLITLADGSQVSVQNLKVGDKMLGYDTATGTYTVSIVNSITVVDTTNMLIIHTSAGTPFRVDANPRQTLWVRSAAGIIGWVPVTQIKAGDDLWTQNGWVKVTSIEFAPAGQHVMYDIFASAPYFADGYLDPIHKL